MRILHLTPYYKPAYAFGGVVRAVEGMATTLAERGHQVTVLTTDAFDHEQRLSGAQDATIEGVRIIRCPNVSTRLRGKLNLSTPRSMKRTAEAIFPAIDVVHTHEFRTLENLLVTPVAQKLNVPIVLSPHGTLYRGSGRGFLKAAWDRTLSGGVAVRVDHVIALTENELAEIKSIWITFGIRQHPTGFSVIPNGVRLAEFASIGPGEEFRKRHNLDDAPVVLFMGRLQARKGLDVLINAFRAADVQNSRLLIVGPDEGMLPTLRSIAGNDSRIVFTGYLGSEERLRAIAASDIFALSATGEGQPIAALEAMAAGLPVILSHGCNMDEVAEWDAGYVVEPSERAFAEKLRALLNDGDLRRQMGANGRRLVEARYTWDRVAFQLEGLYRGLIKRKT